MQSATVLVTGGSGFVGAHAILALLAQGYRVRTTVRSAARETEVRATLQRAGAEPGAALQFFVADLMHDAGWSAATEGCEYVLHIASPFPELIPKNEEDVLGPARDGTVRVLQAARDTGVRRVVLTSSFAAIGYGHPETTQPFDETHWSNLEGGLQPYVKSKTVAERAAWDFIAQEGNGLELVAVNPVGVFGPVLAADYSTSILVVERLLSGALPGCPKLSFGVVDVRDVVDLHLKAMLHPSANGERFLAISGDFMSMREIAETLKSALGKAAKRVPTRELPNWLLHLAALGDPVVKQILPDLGRRRFASSAKAQRLLNWRPRSNQEAILATAQSLLDLGLVKGVR